MPVCIIDGLSVTLGERIVVQHALRLVDDAPAPTVAEIAGALEASAPRVHTFGLVGTLEHLKRVGHIFTAEGAVGEMLSVKCVITVTDGEVIVLGKERGSKRGRTLPHGEIDGVGGIDFDMPAALGYSGLSDKMLRRYLEEYRGVWEEGIAEDGLSIFRDGAAIGVHVGPGGIAVVFSSCA